MTGISWADETWNPVVGCTPVSPGCAHCYAARTALRLERCGVPRYADLARRDLIGRPAWSGAVRLAPEVLDMPFRWRRRRRVFLGSMSDLFHERVPSAFLDRVWDVMEDSDHVFLVLTKRPERLAAWMRRRRCLLPGADRRHIRLGTSVESAAQADRLGHLLDLAGSNPFRRESPIWLSLEPLLGPVAEALGDVAESRQPKTAAVIDCTRFVDWVVVGGESGPGARPMRAEWARDARDLCARCDIPFHFKQWGPRTGGRVLDGRTHDAVVPLGEPCGGCRTCGIPCAAPRRRCRACLERAERVSAAGGGDMPAAPEASGA